MQAERLACEGHDEQALDICWQLRLNVEISVFRRAEVNLLIASVLKSSRSVKFATEALDLFGTVRESHRSLTAAEVQHLEELAAFGKRLIEKSGGSEEASTSRENVEQPTASESSSTNQPAPSHPDTVNVLCDSGWVTASDAELAKPGDKLFTIEGYFGTTNRQSVGQATGQSDHGCENE